jgi:hypothetical protein
MHLSNMEEPRRKIVHLAAQKLSEWFPHWRTLDHGSIRVRDALARAVEEVEKEINGASEYVQGLNGNETTQLLEDISDVTERRLQSNGK